MNFTKINLDQWERGKLFSFYMEHMRIVMSLTANMEVTRLLAFCKKHDLKFYPSMIWIVSKVINSHAALALGVGACFVISVAGSTVADDLSICLLYTSRCV